MTAIEFADVLRNIDLQSLSDEELINFHALFAMKEAEASWVIKCRKYHRQHFTPNEENK